MDKILDSFAEIAGLIDSFRAGNPSLLDLSYVNSLLSRVSEQIFSNTSYDEDGRGLFDMYIQLDQEFTKYLVADTFAIINKRDEIEVNILLVESILGV